MRLEGGRTENLRCRASYTGRNRGNGLGISLRCASAASKVDLHASLTASGSRISGSWEEREFNAAGHAVPVFRESNWICERVNFCPCYAACCVVILPSWEKPRHALAA